MLDPLIGDPLIEYLRNPVTIIVVIGLYFLTVYFCSRKG